MRIDRCNGCQNRTGVCLPTRGMPISGAVSAYQGVCLTPPWVWPHPPGWTMRQTTPHTLQDGRHPPSGMDHRTRDRKWHYTAPFEQNDRHLWKHYLPLRSLNIPQKLQLKRNFFWSLSLSTWLTRMHFSRMRTVRSSSRPGGVSTSTPRDQAPPRSRPPLRPGTPPGTDPPEPGTSPGDLLQGMLGYHLQCMLG